MIKINLLSEGKRPTAVRRAKAPSGGKLSRDSLAPLLFGLCFLGSLLGIAGWGWSVWNTQRQLAADIKSAESEVQKLAPIIKEVEDYKQKKAELERKIAVITDLKANQRGPVRVMDEISRALPELLWLTKLEMKGSLIKVTGESFNINAIANFIENLERVPELREPELLDTKRSKEVYVFSMQVGYKPSLGTTAPAPEPAGTGEATPAATGDGAIAPAGGG
ncbi:MAG TPA: PilN domain-containing protein [Thermoanaerobaculia bacterium]|nr:PilN domain-containing protein [Thermoanaerobaculia bacterium]